MGLTTVRPAARRSQGGRPPNGHRRDPPPGWGGPAAPVGLHYPRVARPLSNSAPVIASVLIVDDDPAFRSLAARMLDEAGLAVAGEAADARAAVAAAHALRPGAILVDVGLPDRSGIELARELLALPWHPRVLLTSADADAASGDDASPRFVAKADLPGAPLLALLVGQASRE